MGKVLFCFLIITSFAFSQETQNIETYNFGHNGMELVARSSRGTVVVSTYNSKMTIRRDIANKIYNLYLSNKLETNKKITVNGIEANVTGKCVIRKKNNLTVVDFYYEIVDWNSGLKEIYKKSMG